MSQVVPQVARFELRYQTTDNTFENVFYAKSTAARWSESVMDAVETAFKDWFSASAAGEISDEIGLFEIVATDLTDLSGLRKSYPVSPALLGGLSSQLLPLNCTWAIKASIGKRGRGISGRTFWPGLCVAQVAHDSMNTGIADTIIAAMNTLITDISAVTGSEGLVIPHFVVGGSRPPSVGSDAVLAYLASDLFVDSQRDRLPFHKKHKRYPVA